MYVPLQPASSDDWYCSGFCPGFARGFINMESALEVSDIKRLPLKDFLGLSFERPPAIIYQVSHCGSTLLGQLLDRLDSTYVLHEPTNIPYLYHSHLLGKLPEKTVLDGTRGFLGTLEQLAGGRRLVVKLNSACCGLAPLVHAAIPECPSYFMVRDPLEVLAGLRNREMMWSNPFLPYLLETKETELESYTWAKAAGKLVLWKFRAAQEATAQGIAVLSYPNWCNIESFRDICRTLDVEFRLDEEDKIREGFAMNSKEKGKKFISDTASKRASASPELQAAAEEIRPIYESLTR